MLNAQDAGALLVQQTRPGRCLRRMLGLAAGTPSSDTHGHTHTHTHVHRLHTYMYTQMAKSIHTDRTIGLLGTRAVYHKYLLLGGTCRRLEVVGR
jgi:hypothetical protein